MSRRRDGIGPALTGRRLLVTGGGTGIGAATARVAAAAGMKVMVTGRRAEPLDCVVASIREAGGEAESFVGDVAGEGASEAMLAAMQDSFGGVDAVFANAGYGVEVAGIELSMTDFRRIFDVNLFAAVDLLQTAGRAMRNAGSPGHLLGCSSILGKFTLPEYGAYSATKAALTHVCRAMRTELRGTGIAVSTVHPVTTRTEFFEVAAREAGAAADSGHLRADGTPKHAPRAFIQPPETVAKAVIRCLRRPRAEVWTTIPGRLATGVFELVPPIYELMLRSQARGATGPDR
jgi:NAD(P)-dependent dehydrogenase (short-subunit alcohol dehydrogenase family)